MRDFTSEVNNMTACELDELIAAASKRRILLAPEVTMMQPSAPVYAIDDPRWWLEQLPQGSLLQVRHPAFGWLSFVLPVESRAQMLGTMLSQALAPAPVPVTPPACSNSENGSSPAASSVG